jgi:hypothetical protein
MRLMAAMISSIEGGADEDFSTGIETPDRVRITWAQRLEFTSVIG